MSSANTGKSPVNVSAVLHSITGLPTQITKRDRVSSAFRPERVLRAISLAMYATYVGPENPHRDSIENRYGLSEADFERALMIAQQALEMVASKFTIQAPTVEEIQNIILMAIIKAEDIRTAMCFGEYRLKRESLRPVRHGENGMQEYIVMSRYCRYSEKHGRRELWSEAIDERVLPMHLKRFEKRLNLATPEKIKTVIENLLAGGIISEQALEDMGGMNALRDELVQAFDSVKEKEILPSMRSLQFGGKAIEAHEARMFNCSFGKPVSLDFFKHYFYLLLCGCGVGFSVQKHHVGKLPSLAPKSERVQVVHHIIGDSIEGWADAVHEMMLGAVKGYHVEFSYHKIRPEGAPLVTAGSTAPGHLALKRALNQCQSILDRSAGRHMRPIEVYDICMYLAKAVLSGGVRRSATICLFSPDDDEMMLAKTGNWRVEHPQRSASNNSAMMVRDTVKKEDFERLFDKLIPFDRYGDLLEEGTYGEPGFYFADNPEIGCNPCVEIGLNPDAVVTEKVRDRLIELGYYQQPGAGSGEIGTPRILEVGDIVSGFQMCNLSTVSSAAAKTPSLFYRLVKHAALIGTFQADYTKMPYLGPVTQYLNEREALIGVSLCGILDNPKVMLDPGTLRRGAEVAKTTNAIVAALLGINRAARTTCVKPEGTASKVLGTASGISPNAARRFIRHVQAAKADKLYQHFKQINSHMCEQSVYDENGATDVIAFAVECPEDGIYQEDMTATRHLQHILTVQSNWVQPGRAYTTFTTAQHNVSNTINAQCKEWGELKEMIWENRHHLTGVAILPAGADNVYAQAPEHILRTEADIRKWNSLTYKKVDYTKVGGEDHSAGAEFRGVATACAGGHCSL